jgi:orotidine-5'-phosphate decarboxylase
LTQSMPARREFPEVAPPGQSLTESARERLIVALDLRSPDENRELVNRLGPAVSFYKVGWGTILRPGGNELLGDLLHQGNHIFLDVKFFDVPNTVQEAVSAVAALGVRFVTVHGNRDIIEAAVQGRGNSGLKVLAVTVLTSLSELDARRMYGMPDNVTLEQHVVGVARSLVDFGCDGVIASPQEVAEIRRAVPQRVVIAAPAIRLPGEPAHDQKRTGTPYESVLAGADYLVVGRSIYEDSDPRRKVEHYVDAIDRGLRDRPR